MLKNKVNKSGVVARLELKGYTRLQAEKIVQDVADVYTEELCKGNKIVFHNIGTLEGISCKATTRKVAGEVRDLPERIRVKLTISKTLRALFAVGFSKEAKTLKGVKELGKQFLGNLK